MSTKSDLGYTEEELKLTSFYSKYKSAMDSLQPTQSVEGRKPTGEAKEASHLNISSGDIKGASRVKRFLESKRYLMMGSLLCCVSFHITPSPMPVHSVVLIKKREAQTVESEPMLKRRRAKVVKNSAGILVSRELNKESFPAADMVRTEDWDSRTAQKSLSLPLENFGFNDGQKQTLVMRITVPKDSTTWAIKYAITATITTYCAFLCYTYIQNKRSICPRKHEDFMNVLFHFNPRQREKGGTLVQNDRRDSTWRTAEKLSLVGSGGYVMPNSMHISSKKSRMA